MEIEELPRDVAEKLDDLLARSGEAQRGGSLAVAIALGLDAWALIPAPQEKWDFYPQIIATGLVEQYGAERDLANLRTWIAETHRAYGDEDKTNAYVNMIEGKWLLDLGETEEAFGIFDAVYGRDGRGWFKGKYKPYLEWYLKERARRRG